MADTTHLPGPSLDVWEWQHEGACTRQEPELFFHPDGERGPSRAGREAAAKAVCRTCPVLERCRDHALAAREPFGVWGGLSVEERGRLLPPG